MRQGCAIATGVVMLALCLQPGTPQAQEEKLQWHLPATSVLEFERTSEGDGAQFGYFEKKLLLTGGQFGPCGITERICRPDMPGTDLLARLVLQLPAKPSKQGFKWNTTFDSTEYRPALDLVPDKIDLACTQDGTRDYAAMNCTVIRVRGTGSDPEPEKQKPGEPYKPGSYNMQITDFVLEAELFYDPENGLPRGFAGTMTAKAPGDWAQKQRKAEFQYQLARFEVSGQRRVLDDHVNRAIEKAIANLRADKSWRNVRGSAALVAYTLLQCGIKPGDETLDAALLAMVEGPKLQQFGHLYHAAVTILALEAKVVPEAERIANAQGMAPGKLVRNLTPEDRKLMQEKLDYLASGTLADTPGLWSYGPENKAVLRPDLSNTQFAVLAFAAAQRCGLELPKGVIKAAGEQVLQFQQVNGPKVTRVASWNEKTGKYERKGKPVEARGFAYHLPDTSKPGYAGNTVVEAYGSMTCAGVCCLLLLADMVESMTPDRRSAEFPSGIKTWRQNCELGIEGGLAWLDQNLSLTRNPWTKDNATNYYFYLYALERTGALAPTEVLGEHQWYNEGAALLVFTQPETGQWHDLHDTCFALLFLKRATIPTRTRILTGK